MWQFYSPVSRLGWSINVVFLLGIILPGYCQKNPTIASIPQLRLELKTATTDSNRAWIANKLSIAYCVMSHDSARYFSLKSIEWARKLPDKHLYVNAYRQLGQAYDCIGQTANSLATLARAERISKQLYNDSTTAIINEAIAFTYTSQGNNDDAIRYYLTALRYYETHRLYRYISRGYNGLGVCYLDTKNYKQALVYLAKSKQAAQYVQDSTMLLFALNNTAFTLFNLNQLQQAETAGQQALTLSRRYNDNWHTVQSLIILGYIQNKVGRFQKAIDYSTQGLSHQNQVGDKTQLARLNSNLADSYMGLQRYPTALLYADKAVAILRTITYNEALKNALFVQAKALEKARYYKLALTTFQEAQLLEDSLTGLEKIKQISRIQSAYDLKRKQDLINQQQQQLGFARQRQFLYLMVVCLLTGLLVLIGFLLRRQQLARRLLARQKDEIHQQAQQLLELNATKDKLFSMISHDLRSPLASLKNGFYQLIQLTLLVPEPVPQTVRQLEGKVDQVLTLLTNLLDWSYSQLKGFRSLPQPINLFQQVDQEVSQIADQLQRKQLTLLNHIDADHYVLVDVNQLKTVLRNLVSNAVKFTPQAGYIRLMSSQRANQVELLIRDTGIGMSKNQVNHLFANPEVRSGTDGEWGTGLGLKICQEMLVHQGGSIAVKSEEGKGTTVKIVLPTA